MKFTIFVALLVAIFAVVYPQCTPDQWEGYQGSLGGYATRDGPGLIKEFVDMHYDFKNKRTAIYLDYVNRDKETKFHVVIRDGRLYVVNESEKSCYTKKMDKPFRQICVPEGAKHMGDYYMGLSGGFKVSSYEYNKKEVTSVFTVQKKGDAIIPIGETVYGRLGHADFVQSVGFADITPGIKNASVFAVPEQCEPKVDFSMMEGLTREHFILAL